MVLGLVLVVFGPKRLPEIGSSLGKGIRDFRQGISHLEGEVVHQDVPDPVESRRISPVPPEHKIG